MYTENKNSSRIWRRFKRNRLAVFAGIFILFVCFIALFAYVFVVDNAPDADTQIVEIATQKPGYSCLFYKKTLDYSKQKVSVLERYFCGSPNSHQLIPIRSFRASDSEVIVQKIIDENTTEELRFANTEHLSTEELQKQQIVSRTFWLGTDRYGRDVFSRLLIGSRVSMAVGIIAVLLSISIGVLLGAFAGYFGGWIDQFITWLINVVWAIPTLLLVFAITFALGKGFWQIFVAVGLTMWVGTARLIRGQVMALKELEYIQSARTMGFSSFRIIVKHILPNVIGPTLVMAASNFATAILIEAGLSFLGIGIQPPTSSWGLMIKEHYNFIITNRPMLAIVPGIAIMLVVLAFNILGNALRDAFDVKGAR